MSNKFVKFKNWLAGDYDPLKNILDTDETVSDSREEIKKENKKIISEVESEGSTRRLEKAEQKGFDLIYRVIAIVSCLLLIGVLLFTVALLPRYGVENPESTTVVKRYVESGLQETGAINIVSGIILDYRAFDTLGESHVLFTALICVTILLRADSKNLRTKYEDFYTIKQVKYHDLYKDKIINRVGMILVPCIFVFGIYVLLNGQNGPGGGFSGGSVMGAGLIIGTAAFGYEKMDRFISTKTAMWITFISLAFYSFAKGYVFFTGANGLDNHIPKGIPGAILSGGLILPLDIAVGMVVACTMYGFYNLFRRGRT